MRNFEHKVGSTLFERTNGGTGPTTQGQEFLDAALCIVDDPETLTAHLNIHSRSENGRLITGVHTSLLAGNLRARSSSTGGASPVSILIPAVPRTIH